MPAVENLYYFENKEEGNGKACIVLLHGAGGTHLHWPHNIRRLGEYRILAPDLPGHGKSGGLGEQTIEGYADVIANWLDEIGVYKAVFIGHSMGGAISLMMALRHQERVAGLGLVGTGGSLPVRR